MDNVFQHLSAEEVAKLYESLRIQGKSEDEIFTEIYALDCNQDNETEEEE